MQTANKTEFKKYIFKYLLVLSAFTVIMLCFGFYQYRAYNYNYNKKINQIAVRLTEEYPEVSVNELAEILNSEENDDCENIFRNYGIDIKEDSAVLNNDKKFKTFTFITIFIYIIAAVCLLVVFIRYEIKQDKKLKEITDSIYEINKKNYKLEIDDYTEDELSILKSELYKLTINLKEQAENSLNDKITIKDAVSDISHQIKTPLTSVSIMLENIYDDPDMKTDIRQDFIKDIRREIHNINSLVQSLLKMSRLDTNTVKFVKREVNINDIIDKAVENVSVLCDIKNITIEREKSNRIIINCDKMWQAEAVTNILKNCVEHSNVSGKIKISCLENKIYSEIKIEDNGKGIAPEDMPYIFKRFYKGKNSGKDSVGIGLALSKSIIEQNNRTLTAESALNKGTVFYIKYFKR